MNRINSGVLIPVLMVVCSGCSKEPPASSSVEAIAPTASIPEPPQSAVQRLKSVKWAGFSKGGARQFLRFGEDGQVVVSEIDPQRGATTRSYIYRIVKEDGEHLTMHFADAAGTSVSGIHLTVARGLDFSPGGAFEMNGHYDPQ